MVGENESHAPGLLRFGDERDYECFVTEIEKEDVMKLKPIYETLYWFIREEGYTHPVAKDDKIEELYWERWVPPGAKEQHIWWRAAKEINPYIRHLLIVNWQTLNVVKAEVAHRGKKVNAEKTDLIIRLRFYLQFDYHDRFKTSWLWKFKRLFYNRVYQTEVRENKDELVTFALRFVNLVKTYFEMHGTAGTQDLRPPMGFKDPEMAK